MRSLAASTSGHQADFTDWLLVVVPAVMLVFVVAFVINPTLPWRTRGWPFVRSWNRTLPSRAALTVTRVMYVVVGVLLIGFIVWNARRL